MMIHQHRWTEFSSVLLLVGLLLLGIGSTGSSKVVHRRDERNIQILNDSGSNVQIYWIHPTTRQPSLLGELVQPGADFPLNSFVGHEFEIREAVSSSSYNRTGTPFAARTVTFHVTDNDDQLATISRNFSIDFVDDKIKASTQAKDIISSCQTSQQCEADLMECVERELAKALEIANEEIAFQASIRRTVAAALEPYSCANSSLESSPDIDTTEWWHDGQEYVVHIKHERSASTIHAIENFITDDECAAVESAARADLHNATVADGKGGSRLSSSRKAMQAGVTVPWHNPSHPIARLSRRTYDYLNHVLGLNIVVNGQEDLMSIQYFGRGLNDTEPDHYTPHCDGDCSGLPHKHGTRMATMVMYCQVAETGGHTNFRNSGVHVQPQRHDSVFFSYIDPETKQMDDGFTEHSGCPVFQGSKKIAVQWFRLGVSDEEPWTAFNTLGIKKDAIV